MGMTGKIKKSAMKTAFDYLERNPEENGLKVLDWVDRLAGSGPDSLPEQRAAFRRVLENPQRLREMVDKTGAHSTDLQSLESVEHLCAKCDAYAQRWKPTAEKLWNESRNK